MRGITCVYLKCFHSSPCLLDLSSYLPIIVFYDLPFSCPPDSNHWKLQIYGSSSNLNPNLKFQVQVKSSLTIISFKFSSLKLEEPENFKSSQVWKVTNLNLKFIKIRTSKVRKELHYDQNFQKMWNKKLFFYIHFRNLKLSKGIIKIIKTCPIFLMIFERVWP